MLLFFFSFQGRPGPKGDPGDSGLPGQKVSASGSRRFLNRELGCFTVWLLFWRLTGLGRFFQLGRIHREFLNITFKLNFCREPRSQEQVTVINGAGEVLACAQLLHPPLNVSCFIWEEALRSDLAGPESGRRKWHLSSWSNSWPESKEHRGSVFEILSGEYRVSLWFLPGYRMFVLRG